MAESNKLTLGFFLFLFTFSIYLTFPLIEKKHVEKESGFKNLSDIMFKL